MGDLGRVRAVLSIGVLASAVCAGAGLAAPATAGGKISRAGASGERPNGYHSLGGLAFSSPTDGWAVGDWTAYDSGRNRTLTRHWDGAHWVPVPSPGPGSYANRLSGVAAFSANDAWAVGYYIDVHPHIAKPLFVHWDGSRWQRVPAPQQKGYYSDVSGTASDDVWTVGWTPYAESGLRISHWDGVSWSNVADPPPDKHGLLLGVDAYSRDDVWAVGNDYDGTALVVHWDGSTWSALDTRKKKVQLQGVTVVSPDDVWAVGRQVYTVPEQLAVGHWDGRKWSWVDAPNGRFVGGRLNEVTAVSANDVWAVGEQGRPQITAKTLIEHWDGKRWTIVPSPNRARTDVANNWNELTDIAAISPDEVWSVGWFWPHSVKTDAIIQQWDGTHWTNFLQHH